jgi:hypothetical protein
MKKRNTQEQDHLICSKMAPRRLSTPWILQRFPLFNSKLGQILATSLREEQTRAREREEWEKRDFGIVTIPRVDV